MKRRKENSDLLRKILTVFLALLVSAGSMDTSIFAEDISMDESTQEITEESSEAESSESGEQTEAEIPEVLEEEKPEIPDESVTEIETEEPAEQADLTEEKLTSEEQYDEIKDNESTESAQKQLDEEIPKNVPEDPEAEITESEEPADISEETVEEPEESSEPEEEVSDIEEEADNEEETEEDTDTESSLFVYYAENAADMVAAIAKLNDSSDLRLVVRYDGDLGEIISYGRAVYYKGTYTLELASEEEKSAAYDTIAAALGHASVFTDEVMSVDGIYERIQHLEDEDGNSDETVPVGNIPEEIVPDEIIPDEDVSYDAQTGLETAYEANQDYSRKLVVLIDSGVNGDLADTKVNLTDDPDDDTLGHGTSMARIIREYGGNPVIISVKAFNDNGSGSLATVTAAMKYAIDMNPDIINFSASMRDTGNAIVFNELVSDAVARGITVVASAGNNGTDASAFTPANIPGVDTVGSCLPWDGISAFKISETSNYGDAVDWYYITDTTSEAAAHETGVLCAGVESLGNISGGWFRIPDVYLDKESAEYTDPGVDPDDGRTFSFAEYTGNGQFQLNDYIPFQVPTSEGGMIYGEYYLNEFGGIDWPATNMYYYPPGTFAEGAKGWWGSCREPGNVSIPTQDSYSCTYEIYEGGGDAKDGEMKNYYISFDGNKVDAYDPVSHNSEATAYTFTDTSGTLSEGGYDSPTVTVGNGDSSKVHASVSGNTLRVWFDADPDADMPDDITVTISGGDYKAATEGYCTGGGGYSWFCSSSGQDKGGEDGSPGECVDGEDGYEYHDASVKLNIIKGGVTLTKWDSEKEKAEAQGDATLENAEFEISRGNAVIGTIKTNVAGSASTANNYLKWGNYTVKEVKAPEGYYLNDSYSVGVQIRSNLEMIDVSSLKQAEDEIWRGGLKVIKHDSDFKDQTPQGDASLAGAEYSIYNISGKTIIVDGKEIPTSGDQTIAVNGKTVSYGSANLVMTLTTDGNGTAETSPHVLPYGTYLVLETKAPKGYLIENDANPAVTGIAEIVSVHTHDEIVTAEKLYDDVIRGQLIVAKADRERAGDSDSPDPADIPQGDATLAGAEFTIYQQSENHVMSYPDKKAHDADQAVLTITADASGIARTAKDALPYGSYYVVETKAPAGYNLNSEWRINFEIREDGEVKDFTASNDEKVRDQIIRGGIEITKYDTDRYVTGHLGPNLKQGDATLEGAEYSIYNISKQDGRVEKNWIEPTTVTNRNQVKAMGEEYKVLTITTDENGHAETAADALPYGTYLIKETKAPEGYLLNENWYSIVEIREEGVIYDAVAANKMKSDQANEGYATDDVIRGGVKFQKSDLERNNAAAQGDASLAGAEITIYNLSPMDIYGAQDQNRIAFHWVESGKEVPSGKGHVDLLHDVVDPRSFSDAQPVVTLTTNEDGFAQIGATALPYGTYLAVETKPSRGYMLNTEWRIVFEIRENGVILDFTDNNPNDVNYSSTKAHQLKEQVIRGDVRIFKEDLELAELNGVDRENYVNGGYAGGEATHQEGEVNPSQAIGGKNHSAVRTAHLNNIEFTVTNESTLSVLSDAGELVEYQPGEMVVVIKSYYNDEVGAYIAETTDKALPYGTYTIQETKSNNAYLLTDGTPRTFEIETDGEIVTTDKETHHAVLLSSAGDPEKMIFRNQIKRGEFEFVKIAGYTTERIQSLWVLENATSNEKHVLVTDPNGEYHSAEFPHSENTNANDYLLEEINANGYDSMVHLEEGLADGSITEYHGLWFGLGEDRDMAEVNDDLNTLPYGQYILHEVRTPSNEGMELQNFSFYITRDQKLVHLGTVTDYGITLSTTAIEETSGSQMASPSADTKLTDTVTYHGVNNFGTYVLKTSLVYSDTGEPVPDKDGNEVVKEQEVRLMTQNGSVKVTVSLDSTKLAGRSVVFFEELYDLEGNRVSGHTDLQDSSQTITFTGIQTTLAETTADEQEEGTIILTDTVKYSGLKPGTEYEMTGTLMNKASGKPFEGVDPVTVKFTPTASEGTMKVVFEIDSKLIGKDTTLVAFERCTQNGIEVAVHMDINDKDQTVEFHEPEIHTTATDQADGDHILSLSTKVTIVDKVDYTGLIPGKVYEVTGTLMDQESGEPVEGIEPVKVEFTPEQSSGSVNVVFEIDSTKLLNRTLVVFEDLYQDGKKVAVHADINDKEQTVTVEYHPGIRTLATFKGDNGKTVTLGESVTLHDEVKYTDLIPGKTYRLEGTVHISKNGKDAGVLKIGEKEIRGAAEFTSEATDGTVGMDFEIDTSSFTEETKLVVFETLYLGEEVIAEHSDITDIDQTVTVKKKEAPPAPTPTPTPTPTPKPEEPSVHTMAYSAANGYDYVGPDELVTIRDIVYYSGLTPGKDYEIRGTLHQKHPDGWYMGEMLVNGNPVTAYKVFTPDTASGSVELEFTFNASTLNGYTAVVFEDLYQDGKLVASHADISDEAQSILISRSPRYRRRRISWVRTGTGMNTLVYGGIGTAAGIALIILLNRKAKQNHK